LYHFILMLTSVMVVTIGSALAKRKPAGREKFKIMLIWFAIALFIILIAIPWPFSTFANRPYLRPF
jgi:drug/metabolite transporter (DMT)-like permease